MEDKNTDGPEISLFDIILECWKKRRYICFAALGGLVLGGVVAFSLPEKYTASVKMVADAKDRGLSSELTGLTSLLGVNLPTLGRDDKLDAALYPEILSSTTLLAEMSRVEIGGQPLSAFLAGFRGEQVMLSSDIPQDRRQHRLLEVMRKSFRLDIDKRSGMISLHATLCDPVAAFITADSLIAKLERRIVGYRLRKSREDLAFISAHLERAREAYHTAQQLYARYADAHRHLAGQSAVIERERLYQEQLLAYGIYSQLAGQWEVARLKVQEETPVLTQIEPAYAPLVRSFPRRSYLLLGGTATGMFVSVFMVSFLLVFRHRKP